MDSGEDPSPGAVAIALVIAAVLVVLVVLSVNQSS